MLNIIMTGKYIVSHMRRITPRDHVKPRDIMIINKYCVYQMLLCSTWHGFLAPSEIFFNFKSLMAEWLENASQLLKLLS